MTTLLFNLKFIQYWMSSEAQLAQRKKLTLQRLNATKAQAMLFKAQAMEDMKVETSLVSADHPSFRRPSRSSSTVTRVHPHNVLQHNLSRGMLGKPRDPLVSIVSDLDQPSSADLCSNSGIAIPTSSHPSLQDTKIDGDRFLRSPSDPRGNRYDLSDRSLLCAAVNPSRSEVSVVYS